MADAIDNAVNLFCPEPDTCPSKIIGLNENCYRCHKRLKRKVSDYYGILVQDRLEKY